MNYSGLLKYNIASKNVFPFDFIFPFAFLIWGNVFVLLHVCIV